MYRHEVGPARTHYAPAGRADANELRVARQEFVANRLAVTLLEAIPDLALVLNVQRQIIAVNSVLLHAMGVEDPESLVGLRPGELIQCVNAEGAPDGCGTSASCEPCGAVNAILECLATRRACTRECRVRTRGHRDGGAFDLEVRATFVLVGETGLAIVAMRDISSEKRRDVLERVFFHDVLNTVTGIIAIAELLNTDAEDPAQAEELRNDLVQLTDQIAEEIVAQRELLSAERGDLRVQRAPVLVDQLLSSVASLYRNHSVARDKAIGLGRCPQIAFETDPTLARRVLGNLLKNALEATPRGGAVGLSGEDRGDHVALSIHNSAVMTEQIRSQIFQRSFSTKSAAGRGIGTHSAKLLTERYLGGAISFMSQEPDGTVFTICLPKVPPEPAIS